MRITISFGPTTGRWETSSDGAAGWLKAIMFSRSRDRWYRNRVSSAGDMYA